MRAININASAKKLEVDNRISNLLKQEFENISLEGRLNGCFIFGLLNTFARPIQTQTCFMSPIDLHTHYSYQIMLPKAIVIVMAPTDTYKTHGIFHLSDPSCVLVIRNCQEHGFHPHEEPPDGSQSMNTALMFTWIPTLVSVLLIFMKPNPIQISLILKNVFISTLSPALLSFSPWQLQSSGMWD